MMFNDRRVQPHGTPTTLAQMASLPPADARQAMVRQAQVYVANGRSEHTRTAYAADWKHFETWCTQEGWVSCPAAPEVVALYLTALTMQGRKFNTLTRRLAALKQAHEVAGLASPTTAPVVQAVLTGIRRTHGIAVQAVDALLTEDIIAMVHALPPTLVGIRDRALLLLGFAGAFRRSELVGLNVEDLTERQEGVAVTLRFSKTDQEGNGRLVGIPYGTREATCPVRAVQAWLQAAGIRDGAVFRGMNRHGQVISARLSGRAVADVIKRTADAAGLDGTKVSGHSLRSGHCTTAARAGVEERVLMQQTGHKSSAMLRRYIRLCGAPHKWMYVS